MSATAGQVPRWVLRCSWEKVAVVRPDSQSLELEAQPALDWRAAAAESQPRRVALQLLAQPHPRDAP